MGVGGPGHRTTNRKPIPNQMKTTIIIALLGALFAYNICTTPTAEEVDEVSWKFYCERYEVNPDEPTNEQLNTYLDCWRGSAEEEEALESIGLRTF